MDNNNFCPFVNGPCRNGCVFKSHEVATETGFYSCLIAIKLMDINEFQSDQLKAIREGLTK